MPPGWDADTCAAAGAACAAVAPPPPAAARALGVGAEGLASLWHQRRGAAARARAAAARRRAPELAAAWRGGDSLASVAARFDVDDDAAARVIHDAVEGRKLVKVSDVRDARLRNEVKALGCFGEAARGAARDWTRVRAAFTKGPRALWGALRGRGRVEGAGLRADAGCTVDRAARRSRGWCHCLCELD